MWNASITVGFAGFGDGVGTGGGYGAAGQSCGREHSSSAAYGSSKTRVPLRLRPRQRRPPIRTRRSFPRERRFLCCLKQAISTKNAREGDAVYAETAFPFVVNDRILVPAGTYIQGKIRAYEHAGTVEEAGGTSAALHVDDLSQRLYRDVARRRWRTRLAPTTTA